MRKLLSAVAITAATVAGLTGIALAGSAPRLGGKFSVRVRITATSGLPGYHKGETGTEASTFKPRCKTGTCATVVTYRGLDGSVHSPVVFKPSGALYRGSLKGASSCTRANSYDATVVASYTVKPTRITNGKVTAFSGTSVVHYVLTKAGRAHHCPKTAQTSVFQTL